MMWMIKNIKDGRVVLNHKRYDRVYIGSLDDCDCEIKLFMTKNIDEAYDVLRAIQHRWSGINVNYWKVVEAYG